MQIPDYLLANELADTCTTCSTLTPATAIDGKSDSPLAIYKCQCGHVWQADWQRGYQKVTPDSEAQKWHAYKDTPPSLPPNPITPHTPMPVKAENSDEPTIINSYDPNPKCKECGFPLGGGHAPVCPHYGG